MATPNGPLSKPLLAKMIYFVTGSEGKFRELSAMLPELKQLKLELDEIQSLDPKKVIEHKLEQASHEHEGELMVEDTSLVLQALGELPGTFIKWFQQALGLDGIAELAAKYPDQSATARTVIGYRDGAGERHYFTGEAHGRIVKPRGAGGFGWDDIFVPEGYEKSFAELGPEEKNRISMRRAAAAQFADHLAKQR
jgi:non-canonical purine NTP pyrophosphatase (RdgB/HAM1 family)